jgi:hypothetical protein
MSNIANGTYRAKPIEAKLGQTAAGNPQVGVLFEVTQDGPEKGKRITWYGYFTEKTEERTLESLRHCGWVGDDITQLGSLKSDVAIVIEAEPDQKDASVMRPRVKWVNSGGSTGVAMKTELAAGKAASLQERIKARVALLAAKKANAVGAPEQQATDDIPF